MSPSAVLSDLNATFGHIIDGKLVKDENAKTLDVINPATEKVIASVPIATRDTLDSAVEAARRAFTTWKTTSWDERAKAVSDWSKTYAAQSESLINLLSTEQGKSLQIATMEVRLINTWFEELPKMEPKEEVVLDDEQRKVIKRYVPLGVCAGIVPWNFPITLMMWKILPAVLCGNCVIIKPSPFTPLCDIRIIQAAQRHFPPGVMQCIVGDDKLGPMITEHPGIDKVAFTGSTATGRLVARSCAASLKRVTLELGGNDANIVLPDVDIPSVAQQVAIAATLNSAQFCCASKRIFVHEAIYEQFKQALSAVVNAMKVGPGMEEGTVHGPINNKMQFEKVKEFFKDSQSNKHNFLTGGVIDEKQTGYFVPVTLVDAPPEDSKLVQEEPFGPIVPLLVWKDEKDLLQRVNASEWGLGAVVFGKDAASVDRIARGIETGTVWTNTIQMYHPRVPFGGWKKSGYGQENGMEAMHHYSNLQTISYAKAA